jgi:hypothetical protein
MAPQVIPAEILAMLLSSPPKSGQFRSRFVHAGKCDAARFSYFPETKNMTQAHMRTMRKSGGSTAAMLVLQLGRPGPLALQPSAALLLPAALP